MRVSQPLAALIVFGSLSVAGATAAQDSGEGNGDAGSDAAPSEPVPQHVVLDEAEARALFEAGLFAFQSSRFEDALQRFTRAFELSGRVELLFNVGLAADRLRRDAIAIDAFERFLRDAPPSTHHSQARERLAFLRGQVAAQEATASEEEEESASSAQSDADAGEPESAPAPAAAPPLDPPEDSSANVGAWALGGAGLGLTLVGVGLLGGAIAASNAVTDPSDGTRWEDVSGRASRGPVLEGLGWASLGLGVAGMVGAIVWLVAGQPDEDSSVALTPNGVRVRWGVL